MKRIFTLIIFLGLITTGAMAQLSGDGSSSSPFYGTITSSVTWDWEAIGSGDGNIYIGTSANNDLTIGSGGHLTILSGATLVFNETTSDLIITGTGQITADANPGEFITFTRASGNQHWGHITFQSMGAAGASHFDKCIFEYGDVSSTSLSLRYGGAMHILGFDDVTIDNSVFQNNRAGWGGGLFIDNGSSPTVSNTIFRNNTATTVGGGIYVFIGSSATISNSIIENNSAIGSAGGGGIWIGRDAEMVRVYNSIITNNSATDGGNNIVLSTNNETEKPQFINCAIWGSTPAISYRNQSPAATDFINCAIYGYSISAFTDCIALNSSNTASDGPNFTDPANSDWSIEFISPLRDAGTATGAPTSDFNGDARIGDYDIGAYEVQYSLWSGTSGTDWTTAGNWVAGVTPSTGTGDVVIPSGLSNYPTTSGNSFTIEAGRHFIVESTARATFNVLTNNGGTLQLISDATGIPSLLFESYTDNGTEDISMFLTGGGGPAYRWHYVAIPSSSGMNKSVFTSVNPYNLLRFDDSRIVTTNMEGWQWHDGWNEETQTTDPGDAFSTLETGRGYNFYHTEDVTVQFPTVTGLVNAIDAIINLQFNGNGLNLLGNSLTCSINWDEAVISGNMRDAIYFTKNNALAAYVNGVGSPAETTGIIPPLQGFFVKALEEGCTVNLSNTSVRTHGDINRYKGTEVIPLLRLELLAGGTLNDETVVRFSNDATTSFDSKFDASKLFASASTTGSLWTELEGESYVINGIPFPEDEFLLPVSVNIKEAGTHSLKRTVITGLEDYRVELVDNYQSFTSDLKSTADYSFSSDAGLFVDRFTLKISPMATGLDETLAGKKELNIFVRDNILNIQPLDEIWNGQKPVITVYDLTGRVVERYTNWEFYNGELVALPFSSGSGIYLLEIRDGARRVTERFVKQ